MSEKDNAREIEGFLSDLLRLCAKHKVCFIGRGTGNQVEAVICGEWSNPINNSTPFNFHISTPPEGNLEAAWWEYTPKIIAHDTSLRRVK